MKHIILSLLAVAIVSPAAHAELREIDGLACHMQPGKCIMKNGKYYVDWTAADQAVMDKYTEGVNQNQKLWNQAVTNGWNPTIGNCGLWDAKNDRPYPGTDALFAKYGLRGQSAGNGPVHGRDIDGYLKTYCAEMHQKFASIKDPVRRLDIGLEDHLAYDAWIKSQPMYACTTVNGNCKSCTVVVNGHYSPVSCTEGVSKQIPNPTKWYRDTYQTWKNPLAD